MGIDIFPLNLDEEMAWILRENLRPGILTEETLSKELHYWVSAIRQKVNAILLRFLDESDLNAAPIYIGEKEAWIIDSVISYNGTGGSGTEILIQLFRGLWGLEFGLPTELVPEPTPIAATPEE